MKTLWNKKLTGAVLAALALGSSGVAWAEEPVAEGKPEEVVITANRLKNAKADTPADVTVITSQQISDRGYRNVTDALEDVSGARVLDASGPAFERRVILNGDDRVVVMVDGRRVNYSMGSTNGNSTFDANTLPGVSMIERIEVVKGGASTLYGADAVGGVINIITKTPEETTGNVHVGYGSWGTQDLGLSFGGKENKTGFQVGVNRNKASYLKYKDTNGDTKRWDGQSDYTQDAISLKLTQDFTKRDRLTVNYDYSNLDGNFRYGLYNYGIPNNDQRHTTKKTNNVGIRYDWNRDAGNSGYVQAYRNYYGYTNFGVNPANNGDMSEIDWGLEGQQNFVLSDTNTLVAGLEYRNAKVDHVNLYSNGSYNNKAVFLQDQWKFAPTWQLNTGVRYDDHSKAGNRTTGSVAVNKKFSKDSNAYLSWNSVFRAPTTDNLFWYQPEWYMLGNENLKPETGNVWSAGYNFKIDAKTNAGIKMFYSQLHNAIRWASNPTTFIYEPINVDKEKKRGMTLSIEHHLNKLWDIDASYTYVKATGKPEGYIRDDNYAPNYYQAGVRYHDTKWNLNLRVRAANGLSKKGRSNSPYSNAGFGENRYLTMDFIARYKFTHNWTGFANFYNLNNAAYAEYSGVFNNQDIYPMPGRRIIVGAEYSF